MSNQNYSTPTFGSMDQELGHHICIAKKVTAVLQTLLLCT